MLGRLHLRVFRAIREILMKSGKANKWLIEPSISRYLMWLKSLIASGNIEHLVKLDQAWLPYKAINLLEHMDQNTKVFEWGSGASTIWFARRFESIVSIEHDPSWHHSVRQIVKNYTFRNIKLTRDLPQKSHSPTVSSGRRGYKNLDFLEYVHVIGDHDKFDLIVIDGRARVECLWEALNHLNVSGTILLDNAQRRRYWKAVKGLKGRNQTRVVFGLTSSSLIPTVSLFIYS